jgi:hypothetical protein
MAGDGCGPLRAARGGLQKKSSQANSKNTQNRSDIDAESRNLFTF